MQIGPRAKQIRETLGWTQRETATALNISYVHLCNVENNKAKPSQSLIDKFVEIWGIDLYVLAWCEDGDSERLPKSLRSIASDLSAGWEEEIRKLVEEHRREIA